MWILLGLIFDNEDKVSWRLIQKFHFIHFTGLENTKTRKHPTNSESVFNDNNFLKYEVNGTVRTEVSLRTCWCSALSTSLPASFLQSLQSYPI